MDKKIIVHLSEDDAALFVKFNQFHEVVKQLDLHGAVGIKNGSVTLNFDKYGTIRSVQVIRNYFS